MNKQYISELNELTSDDPSVVRLIVDENRHRNGMTPWTYEEFRNWYDLARQLCGAWTRFDQCLREDYEAQ